LIDIIKAVDKIIIKPSKRWYISKTDDPDNPQCLLSDDNELWVRPDIWRQFVSNTWVKGNETT